MNEQLGFRLLIESIPDDAVRQETLRYLTTLFPQTPPDKIKEKLDELPFYLNREPLPVAQAKPVVDKLLAIGVELKVVVIRDGGETVMRPTPPGAQGAAPAAAPAGEKRDIFSRLRKEKVPSKAAAALEVGDGDTSAVAAVKPEKRGQPKAKEAKRFAWDALPRAAKAGLVALPLLLVAAGAGYWYLFVVPAGAPAPGSAAVAPTAQPQTTATPLAEKLRRQWYQSYRPGPDQRFVEAYRLAAVLKGQAAPSVTVTPLDADWRIGIEGGRSFVLANFADFDALWQQLEELYPRPAGEGAAQGVVERGKGDGALAAVHSVIGMFWAPTQLEALRQLQAEGGARGGEYHQLLAEATFNLAIQSNDASVLTDRLFAISLVHTLAAEHAGRDVSHLKTLLAWSMGYQAATGRMAVNLVQDHPVRQLVGGDLESFIADAQRDDASIRRRYLALLAIAAQSQDAQVVDAAAKEMFKNTEYQPAVLAATAGLGDDAYRLRSGRDLMTAMLKEMQNTAEADAKGRVEFSGAAVADFERLAARFEPQAGGEFSVDTISLLYWRQAFWNGLAAHADAMGKLGPRGLEWIKGLGGESQMAQEFRAFLESYLPAEVLEPRAVGELLASFKQLPWDLQLDKMVDVLMRMPDGRDALRQVAKRGDQRPGKLVIFGILAEKILKDRARSEDLFSQALAVAPRANALLLPKQALARGNITKLRGLVADEQLSPQIRLLAFQELEKVDQADLRDGKVLFGALLRNGQGEHRMYQRAIRFFIDAGDYDSAGVYVTAWLNQLKADSPVYAVALAHKAELLRVSGQPEQGWELIRQYADSEIFPVRAEAALAAQAVGEDQQALEIAGASYRQNRGIPALMLNLELRWRGGAYPEAADLLFRHGVEVTWQVWRNRIAPLYVELFQGRPEEAKMSLEALEKMNFFPFNMAQFSIGVKEQGGPVEIVFGLIEKAPAEAFAGLEIQLEGYRMLAELRGEPQALDWLRKHIPPDDYADLPDLFYATGQDELLWTFFQDTASFPAEERLWLLRAAASLRDDDGQAERRTQLSQHYRDAQGGLFVELGRYLMGKEGNDQIIASHNDPDTVCRIAYYLGVKAEGAQRIQDASTWMQVALETDARSVEEYRWAERWLEARVKGE